MNVLEKNDLLKGRHSEANDTLLEKYDNRKKNFGFGNLYLRYDACRRKPRHYIFSPNVLHQIYNILTTIYF